jgi:hypothetical protein
MSRFYSAASAVACARPRALRAGIGVGAVIALVFVIAAGAEAKTFGGVVADIPTGAHPHRAPVARTANLPYGGGPVLHANRTHLIFRQPAGSGLGYDAGYGAAVETFLAAVAADSHNPANVYGLSGQYRDGQGPAAYASTYGGAVLATDRLPRNGCGEPLAPPLGTGPGWSVCLSDQQLTSEITHVIAVDHLATGPNDIYFLVTPNGLGSCENAGPTNCALGGSADGSYCGYHSSNPDGTVLYAVIPYNAVSGHCQSDNPRPNSSTADPAISTISHEHNETVTDPLGTAWIDGSGNENGDLCIGAYGPNLGGSGAGLWDEVIHGQHYYLQEEWSNENGSCQARDEADSISFSGPTRTQAGKRVSFIAHAGDPDGRIVAYNWYFGDGTSHSRVSTHSFRRAGVYRVVLRSTDRAGNWPFDTRTVRVSKAPAKRSRTKRRG